VLDVGVHPYVNLGKMCPAKWEKEGEVKGVVICCEKEKWTVISSFSISWIV
jgi:hypothetical protein